MEEPGANRRALKATRSPQILTSDTYGYASTCPRRAEDQPIAVATNAPSPAIVAGMTITGRWRALETDNLHTEEKIMGTVTCTTCGRTTADAGPWDTHTAYCDECASQGAHTKDTFEAKVAAMQDNELRAALDNTVQLYAYNKDCGAGAVTLTALRRDIRILALEIQRREESYRIASEYLGKLL